MWRGPADDYTVGKKQDGGRGVRTPPYTPPRPGAGARAGDQPAGPPCACFAETPPVPGLIIASERVFAVSVLSHALRCSLYTLGRRRFAALVAHPRAPLQTRMHGGRALTGVLWCMHELGFGSHGKAKFRRYILQLVRDGACARRLLCAAVCCTYCTASPHTTAKDTS